jgi:hypothetical protein
MPYQNSTVIDRAGTASGKIARLATSLRVTVADELLDSAQEDCPCAPRGINVISGPGCFDAAYVLRVDKQQSGCWSGIQLGMTGERGRACPYSRAMACCGPSQTMNKSCTIFHVKSIILEPVLAISTNSVDASLSL